MKQRKAQEQVLPKRGKPRVRVTVSVQGVEIFVPWAVIDKRKPVAPQAGQIVVDNLGDLGYGGDER